jgi:ribosomal protein S18 acetylase RimI-like enzyme
MEIRPLSADDRAWVDGFIQNRWRAPTVVGHGTVYTPAELPGFVALEGSEPVGLLTYSAEGNAWEIVTVDSLVEGRGVGTALLDAVAESARAAGCRRLWLITTNDNLPALRFYQKRGFVLVRLHRGAVAGSRRLKPEIPLTGSEGIPIRDELELELEL